MPRPSETALRGRARAVLEAMTERARWVYALPQGSAASHVRPILVDQGLAVEEEDQKAGAFRASNGSGSVNFSVLESAELEVTLVEASGADAQPILAAILDRTGFFAQSRLLGIALDVREAEAPKALRTLAHMVVGWDEDWSDLFLLHLASPDAVVRHEATVALTIAVMVARDAGPAPELLAEALHRETFPKLAETMREAANMIQGLTGGAVELPPDTEP
jgi:hypothetical protein